MKIAVVGSRTFPDPELVEDVLYQIFWEADGYDDTIPTFISGGCIGVDTIAEKYITDLNKINPDRQFPIKIFKPNWTEYGKAAGFIRNKQIILESDFVIAFWDGLSKGTLNSIELAQKHKKPINIYIRTPK